jgi:hypothetical protein
MTYFRASLSRIAPGEAVEFLDLFQTFLDLQKKKQPGLNAKAGLFLL